MLVLGSQMHIVNLILTMIELLMLGCLLFPYLLQPRNKQILLFLILLLLLIAKNITRGIFPDPDINISLVVQNVLVHGVCFLTACYLPFYFYKGLGFENLRPYVKYGVPLCLILPFFAVFLCYYPIQKDLESAVRYAAIVPFIYSIVLSVILAKAIRRRYKECGNENKLLDEVAVYYAALPWVGLPILSYFHVHKLTEVLCSNAGFLIVTVILIAKSIKRTRSENARIDHPKDKSLLPEIFHKNCRHYNLTDVEIIVAEMVCKGMTNKEIGDEMHKSEETVKKQVQSILKKTEIKNRAGLMHKLCNIFPG